MQNDVILHFSDETKFQSAISKLRNFGVKIKEFHAPNIYSNDHFGDGQKARNSTVAVGLVAGIFGAMVAFIFQLMLQASGYRLSVEGSVFTTTVAYMPIVFAGAFLFAGVSMFFHFYRLNREHESISAILPISDQFYIVCSSDSENSEKAISEIEREMTALA